MTGEPAAPARERTRLRAGLLLPIVQPTSTRAWEDTATVDDLLRIATRAEAAGFDHLACADHAALTTSDAARYTRPRFYDPLPTLGYLAGVTTAVRLLSYVLVVPLRHPLPLAKALATVDQLSKGRLVVGVGTGGLTGEITGVGVDFARRADVTDEYLEAVAALWTGEPTTRHGRHCSFDDLVCDPAPVQLPRPRVLVGGNSKRAIRRAAAWQGGWMPVWCTPDDVRAGLSYARSQAGHVLRDFEVLVSYAPLGGKAPLGEAAPPMRSPDRTDVGRLRGRLSEFMTAGATGFLFEFPAPDAAALEEAVAWADAEILPWLNAELERTRDAVFEPVGGD